MHKNLIRITILFAALCVISGCAQKVRINIYQPGELKLTGLSKIAVLPFNSIKTNIKAGKLSADSQLCSLARRCITDSLYKEPFFQLVDLDLENDLTKINSRAKPNNRLDGILYGQVWWQISNEYENYTPSKMNLRTQTAVRYVCGTNDDGSARYCTRILTTKTWDEFYKSHYRVVTASLMMSLSVYRLDRNGKVEKIAQVFEIGRKPALIENGEFVTKEELIGFKKDGDRSITLKQSDGFNFTTLSTILGLTAKSKEKSALNKDVTNKNESIPAPLNMENCLSQTVAGRLKSVIQPHSEEFEVVMHGKDKKTQTLFITEAYRGLTKYLALKIADKNIDLADELLDDLTFDDVVQKALLRKMKAEYAASQADLPEAEKTPFVAPSKDELAEEARSDLSGMTNDIYNIGLAFEGLGNFDKALEIYRYGFENYENTDQDMADGIGRCSLALDMANRVDEEDFAAKTAKRKARMKGFRRSK